MDTTVVESVLSWVEAHPALVDARGARLPVVLEDLPADGTDAVMLASLAGDPYIARYKSGGYVTSYPFGVYLRLGASPDTNARLDAMATLGDMAASIDDRKTWPSPPEGYHYTNLVLRTTPARIAEGDDGAVDYQVTFELMYLKKG
jgi:hypothetical protein